MDTNRSGSTTSETHKSFLQSSHQTFCRAAAFWYRIPIPKHSFTIIPTAETISRINTNTEDGLSSTSNPPSARMPANATMSTKYGENAVFDYFQQK